MIQIMKMLTEDINTDDIFQYISKEQLLISLQDLIGDEEFIAFVKSLVKENNENKSLQDILISKYTQEEIINQIKDQFEYIWDELFNRLNQNIKETM